MFNGCGDTGFFIWRWNNYRQEINIITFGLRRHNAAERSNQFGLASACMAISFRIDPTIARQPSDFHLFAGVVFCRACNFVRLFWATTSLGLIRRAALSCSIASEIRPICPKAAPKLLCAFVSLGLIRNASLYWSIASEVRPVWNKAVPRLLCASA